MRSSFWATLSSNSTMHYCSTLILRAAIFWFSASSCLSCWFSFYSSESDANGVCLAKFTFMTIEPPLCLSCRCSFAKHYSACYCCSDFITNALISAYNSLVSVIEWAWWISCSEAAGYWVEGGVAGWGAPDGYEFDMIKKIFTIKLQLFKIQNRNYSTIGSPLRCSPDNAHHRSSKLHAFSLGDLRRGLQG